MSKINDVFARLVEWQSVKQLTELTGWLPKTISAALSVQARKRNLTIERRRIDGVTSYRIKPEEYNAEDDLRQSVNVGLAAVKERMESGGPSWPREDDTAA